MTASLSVFRGVLFLCAVSLVAGGCAQLELPEEVQIKNLELNPRGDFSLNEILNEPIDSWRPQTGRLVAAGYPAGPFWVRFRIAEQGGTPPSSLILLFHSHRLDRVELHPPGAASPLVGGNHVARQDRNSNGAEPAFYLARGFAQGETFYARLEGEAYLNFPLELYSAADYARKRELRLLVQLAGYGLTVVLSFVCLLFFLIASRSDALFILGFIGLNALSLWSGFGNAYDIFWPDFPVWQPRLHYFFCFLALVALSGFARLVLADSDPIRLRQALAFSGALSMAAAIASLLPLPPLARIVMYAFVAAFAALVVTFVAPVLVQRRDLRLYWLSLGWLFYFGPIALQSAYDLGLLPYKDLYIHAPALAFPLVAVFSAFLLLTPRPYPEKAALEKLSADSRDDRDAARLQGVDVPAIFGRLAELLETERIYSNPELRLETLAARLGLAPHQLSLLLNRRLDVGFAALINAYRIREILNEFARDSHETALTIAFNAGFDTKSNFNKTFKKMTGFTPREVRRNVAVVEATAPVFRIPELLHARREYSE